MAQAEATTQDLHQEAFRLLGGAKTLKTRKRTPDVLVSLIRQGFRPATLAAVADNTNIPLSALLRLVALPLRTWHRKAKEGEPLSLAQSDRLYRLVRMVARATDVFDDREVAVGWMLGSNRALEGQSPLDVLDTEVGEEQVRTLLGRIEYGVYT
jgi:putative toxin-antitoxin system antitoxin component (TIGR02293 family)